MGEVLDPERLRAVLASYFERMKAIVERHGGTVEKFIGDAVMAVFGVPSLHEDDALRAVRAAIEMRDAIPELGLQGRIGVMTGEVVTGTAERLATGDAVNVAARLEQAAQPGEVLIGQPTLELTRGAVEVEATDPLELKGKSMPVSAYRVLSVHDLPERSSPPRFVGREPELAAIRDEWNRSQAEQRCRLVTIIGDAGVGKSRLVTEFLEGVDATVARGRCLPYGEGITYAPVVEILRQLPAVPKHEAVTRALAALLGESQVAASAEEIAWAFRKTLEETAASGPLIAVFDDIQWGEEPFRDLIEHVALLSSGASILLVCMARSELTEAHPAWPVTIRLAPLDEQEVDQLMVGRVPIDVGERIARVAGGNPLFVEEMVAMTGEVGGDVSVPPSLHALLGARLDQLDVRERAILERGSIEGEVFHRGAVQSLAPDDSQVTPHLASLVRKGMIVPVAAELPDQDAFRFRHLLLRDAAYDALPKARRSELHARLAGWLEAHASALVELDEVVGYHLEQANRYRAELGNAEDPILAATARRRLTAAGRRAQLRSDFGAAATLYERAAALVPPTEIDLALETELGEVMELMGRGVEALRRADALAARASLAGDRVAELSSRISATVFRTNLEPQAPEGSTERLAELVDQALPVFRDSGNDVALYVAHFALGQVPGQRGQLDKALAATEQAAAHARQAGLPHELLGWRASFRIWGSTPVSQLVAWLDEHEPRSGSDYHWLRAIRAQALARLARFAEAHALLTDTRAEVADRGASRQLAALTGIYSQEVELIIGDPATAVALGVEGCGMLEGIAEWGRLSTAAGYLAQGLCALGRLDEAEGWASRAEELGSSDDVITQMLWRQARAKVMARRGNLSDAERLARGAVDLGEATDLLDARGDAFCDLAEVLTLARMPDEAAAALETAIERYERKENRASAGRAQSRLSQLRSQPR